MVKELGTGWTGVFGCSTSTPHIHVLPQSTLDSFPTCFSGTYWGTLSTSCTESGPRAVLHFCCLGLLRSSVPGSAFWLLHSFLSFTFRFLFYSRNGFLIPLGTCTLFSDDNRQPQWKGHSTLKNGHGSQLQVPRGKNVCRLRREICINGPRSWVVMVEWSELSAKLWRKNS